MKALFVCDHRFSTLPDGRVFTGGRYPYRTWERYLEVFESLVVVGRASALREEQSVPNLNLSSGPRVEFSFMPHLNTLGRHFFEGPEAKRTIAKLLSRVDAAIVRLPSLNGEIAGDLAIKMEKPFAVEMVGCPWDALWNHGTLRGRLYAPVSYFRTRKLVRKAPFILYVTDEFLQRRYPSRAGVSQNVSDVALPTIAAVSNVSIPARELYTKKEFPKRDPLAVFHIGLTGSFRTSSKGIQVALRALASVVDSLPAFHFYVIGPGDPGPYRELASRLGLSQFMPEGELPGTKAVFEWLGKLDLYIQPSLQEGLPRALVEAMSQGLPALGSSAGGIPELLDRECLHKPGDWRTLGAQISKAANDFEWRQRQSLRNKQRAEAFRDELLNARRGAFWKDFGQFVRERSVKTASGACIQSRSPSEGYVR
jgi:glycosyltransferase involved in cell wall biosynthesis